MLEMLLQIAGLLLILLALSHVAFPKRFHWAEELPRLSLLNRQIFLVHSFFISLTVGFMGVLSLAFPTALLEHTTLARFVLAGLCLFWFARLLVQWFVYDQRLWRGNRFNTMVHVLFTGLWSYLALIYGWAFWQQIS